MEDRGKFETHDCQQNKENCRIKSELLHTHLDVIYAGMRFSYLNLSVLTLSF